LNATLGAEVIETLKRICALQPAYSSANTPEMQERGVLIRSTLPSNIREYEAELRAALGPFASEFDTDASDGIGRKTEAPWVRIHARNMSPTARDGFYVVIHFAADGSAVFLTVGCGSTVWTNGELKPVSDAELTRRTEWARQVVQERFGSLHPFEDSIDLGAKAKLPRTFEKATALAKRFPVDVLSEAEVRDALLAATIRLRCIYDAQQVGAHLTASAATEIEVEALSRPRRVFGSGQGFGLTAAERIAVETRAMTLARQWLESEGFTVIDKSKNSPFDYEAAKGSLVYKIEVKGTTAATSDAILMTRNEVELHTNEKGKTGLVLVSAIQLEKGGREPKAKGGKVQAELGWDIGTWDHVPLAFRLSRQSA
jgi:hypothetical protein